MRWQYIDVHMAIGAAMACLPASIRCELSISSWVPVMLLDFTFMLHRLLAKLSCAHALPAAK